MLKQAATNHKIDSLSETKYFTTDTFLACQNEM